MVEEAQKKIAASGLKNLSSMKLDLEKDALPAERYRLVYSGMALHHVHDVDGVLARLAELTEPGGHLAIADLEPEDGSFHGSEADVHHGFDPAELGLKLARYGFTQPSHRRVYTVKREGHDYSVFLLTARRADS